MPKLLNKDEDIPSELYIFVNEFLPITAHNLRFTKSFSSGAFSSLDFPGISDKYVSGSLKYLPYAPCQMDAMGLSPYLISAINDYRIEYDIEVFREKFYPIFPSRLSAIYAFGDMDACREADKKYHWGLNTVKKFRLIDNPFNRVVKVNMEHVSLSRHAYKVSMLDEKTVGDFWKSYWQGDGNVALELPMADFSRKVCQSGLLWEYLIEGRVQLVE